MTVHFEPFETRRMVLWTFRKAIDHFRNRRPEVFSLGDETHTRGNALFSYDAAFHVLSAGLEHALPNSHTNYWQAMEMIETLMRLGFRVDVIDSNNTTFVPTRKYSVLVATRRNLDRLAPQLGPDCIKILHIDTANILFHNAAESRRLLELQRRKGVTLRPQRSEGHNRSIEAADCATTVGNAFTIGTYEYAKKPIYRLPYPAAIERPWPAEKDWLACRRRFMWLSSGGLVHKGLDLALDAFAEMPEYHLTVCAPIDREDDFAKAYRKELFQTPNIQPVGWVDVGSERFREITASSVALLSTSCSEGGAGSALTCMHAGVIPIVSYEASTDVDDFGFLLKSCSIGDIKDAIRMVGGLPVEELKSRARKAWESARANHTREKFSAAYRAVLTEILATYSQRDQLGSTG